MKAAQAKKQSGKVVDTSDGSAIYRNVANTKNCNSVKSSKWKVCKRLGRHG